jgi:PAS domain S-box-containing protein
MKTQVGAEAAMSTAPGSSSLRLQALIDGFADPLLGVDREGIIRYANASFQRSLGYLLSGLLARPLGALLHPDDSAAVEERLTAALRTPGASGAVEHRLQRGEGGWEWVETTPNDLSDPLGQPFLVLHLKLVTSRRHMEEGLRRSHRALELLTACDAAVVRASSEEQLFREVCEAVVAIGGYKLCWVGLAEHDERRSVRQVAHAGHGAGYLAQVDLVWSEQPGGRGPVGRALRTGQPMLGVPFEEDPALERWRAGARSFGFSTVSAIPLLHEGEPVGVVAMYSAGPVGAGEAELEIFTRLANNVAFALVSLRGRAARDRAEAALRESEARLRQAQADGLIGTWRMVPGRPLEWSDQMYELAGLQKGEVITPERVAALVHPEDREGSFSRGLAEAVEHGRRTYSAAMRIVRGSGEVRHLISRGAIHRDASGAVVEISGTSLDVTDLRLAEEEARRGAARLSVLSDASKAFAEAGGNQEAVLSRLARAVTTALADVCYLGILGEDGGYELAVAEGRGQAMNDAVAASGGARALVEGSMLLRGRCSGEGARLVGSGELPIVTAQAGGAQQQLAGTIGPHSVLAVPLRAHGVVLGGLVLARADRSQPPLGQASWSWRRSWRTGPRSPSTAPARWPAPRRSWPSGRRWRWSASGWRRRSSRPASRWC